MASLSVAGPAVSHWLGEHIVAVLRKSSLVLAATLALTCCMWVPACMRERKETLQCPVYSDKNEGLSDVSRPEIQEVWESSAQELETSGQQGWVGNACEQNSDCSPGICVTKEFLENLGLEIDNLEITNGMCTRLWCNSDELCGPEGVCYDASKFAGESIKLCLRQCRDLADCRWQENYSCYKDDASSEYGVCLPDSIIVAILCDDGHCD